MKIEENRVGEGAEVVQRSFNQSPLHVYVLHIQPELNLARATKSRDLASWPGRTAGCETLTRGFKLICPSGDNTPHPHLIDEVIRQELYPAGTQRKVNHRNSSTHPRVLRFKMIVKSSKSVLCKSFFVFSHEFCLGFSEEDPKGRETSMKT